MTKSSLRKLLDKVASKSRHTYHGGSKGKFGNSKKPVTAVQKHKGKGY